MVSQMSNHTKMIIAINLLLKNFILKFKFSFILLFFLKSNLFKLEIIN